MKKINLKEKGITLIALVVTIIILLILAGVTIGVVTRDNGLFSKAESAVKKYGQEKAKEKLELVLSDAQIQKYKEGLEEKQLDRKIQEIGELMKKEDPNSNIQNVIVDGYTFKIDKSVPKIIEYVGPADGIIITAVLSNNAKDGWLSAEESDVNIKGKIITYSGGKITKVSAKSGETPIEGFSIDEDGKYEITHITESSIITIEAEDSNKKANSKTIDVEVKIDKTAPTVETVKAEVEGEKVKLSATGHDKNKNGYEESGIKEFNYTVTPPNGAAPVTGKFDKNEVAEITITDWILYTIKVTAIDRVGNITEEADAKEQTVKKKDTTPPAISNATAKVAAKTIKISATATDSESGVKQINYSVSPKTITPASGTINSGEEIKLIATELKEYVITFTATDNALNTSEGVIRKATTSDKMSAEAAKDLVTSMSELREHMGEEVTYKDGKKWHIFYYDEGGRFGPKKTLYLQKAFETEDLKAVPWYNKTSNTDPAVKMMRRMNPEWANSSYSEIDLTSERGCVWLCDTTVWNSYRNAKYSSFAIGSPSLEMWIEAANQRLEACGYSDRYYCSGANAAGVGIKVSVGDPESVLKSKDMAFQTPLIPETELKINGYWLCTPSQRAANCICATGFGGTWGPSSNDTRYYCSPIVPLDI